MERVHNKSLHNDGEFKSSVPGLSQDQNSQGEGSQEKYSDGTGRQARPGQIKILDWYYQNEHRHVKVIQAPTGAGKSFIAKSIAQKGTVILVPDNTVLDDTYVKAYPHLNVFKGRDHYDTYEDYLDAKNRLWRGEVTLTNPMAWYYFTKFYYNPDEEKYRTKLLIIDECHKLEDMLRSISGGQFSETQFPKIPNSEDPQRFIKYFEKEISKLYEKIPEASEEDKPELQRTMDKLQAVKTGLEESSSQYTIQAGRNGHGKRVINIQRQEVDPEVLQTFQGGIPLLLMSATPRDSDCELFSPSYVKYEAESTIPVASRRIKYIHTGMRMNRDTSSRQVKAEIDKILAKHTGQNVVIHLPYWRQREFADLYPHAITHESWNKKEAIEAYKEQGGILLASGCAEGVDLPGELCRVQIIPWMLSPSLGDKWVKSRLALPNGRVWYDEQVLLTFAQMCGRSTRGADDHSTVYTFDSRLQKLYADKKVRIWKWFKDAIEFQWRR
jgi:Rad3-related DNA helicase